MSDRRRVQTAFHRGACQYDQHTPVQQRVIEQLLFRLSLQHTDYRSVLDIGCGTGRLLEQLGRHYPALRLSGLDLAEQMLHRAAERLPADTRLLQGDAEQLPFADQEFDLVVSSSTFQWLARLDGCFEQVRRVLQPGGQFLFSLFGEGTLHELQESWRLALEQTGRQRTSQQDGTHRFHTADQVQQELRRAGFTQVEVWTGVEVICYPDVVHLLQAIKRIGAGTARPPAGGGLGWRQVLHTMAAHYAERFGTPSGVPASYAVIYAAGRR